MLSFMEEDLIIVFEENEMRKTIIEVENQLGRQIKVLGTVIGGEVDSIEFNQFCKENGIIH